MDRPRLRQVHQRRRHTAPPGPDPCACWRRWKAAQETDAAGGAVSELSLQEKPSEDAEKKLPDKKKKKKSDKPEIVLEVSTRSKKKSVTTVLGARPSGARTVAM